MILCCAAPALVAGGLLASLGAVIRSPVVIALGVIVVGGACFRRGPATSQERMLPAPGRSGSGSSRRRRQAGRALASLTFLYD